jgi:uncharacterized protein
MVDQITHNNLSQIKQLKLHFGVYKAYACDGAAKDTMNTGSDIDFIIAFHPDLNYETYGTNYFNLLYALTTLLKRDIDLEAEGTITIP